MPAAQPLPKKHTATIRDALGDLKGLAQRIGWVIEQIDAAERPALPLLKPTLQEVQASCYAVALRLSEIELAENCDTCPCAPARTSIEIYLALLSQKLRQLSEETWQTAQGAAIIHLYDDEGIN